MAAPAAIADETQVIATDETAVVNTDESASVDIDDQAEDEGMIVEEVVVQGIRSSLRTSAEIKRNNVGVMEAI
ncbi:unnamed protein product [marine sediment metagenome]|uniref:Uncharacterized protein n=1 Tax=marine sediment metagenome TaxID=412755 RepID=X1F155_9ZZZZ